MARVHKISLTRLFVALLLAASILIVPRPSFAAPRISAPDTTFVSHVLTTEHGLPQNSSEAIVRTSDGYLWVGTLQGLARFDGHNFDVFTSSETDGLAGDRILSLLEGRDGALWIGTQTGGLSRYAGGRFTAFRDEGFEWPHIDRLYQGPTGRIWIAGPEGLASWHQGRFTRYPPMSGARAMVEDHAGVLWVATGDGLRRIGEGRIERVLEGSFSALAVSPDGALWAGSPRGLFRRTGARSFQQVHSEPVYALAVAPDSSLWIGLPSGAARMAHGVFTRYEATEPIGAFGFGSDGRVFGRGSHLWTWSGKWFTRVPVLPAGSRDALTEMLVDKSGLIWIGTRGSGLVRLRESPIGSYTLENGLPTSVVHGVLTDQLGAVWAGTFGGGIVRITDDGTEVFTTREGLASNNVKSVAESADGTVWAAGSGKLARFDGTEFHVLDGAPPGVDMVAPSARGGLWLGTERGRVFGYREGVLHPVPLPDHVSGHGVQVLREVEGVLWIGFGDGRACRYAGSAACLRPDDGFPAYPIREVWPADPSGGVAWLGTYGGGLCRADFTDPSVPIVCLTQEHGLVDNTVHRVLEDSSGFVWLPSNRGLMRVRRGDVEAFFRGERSDVYPDVYTVIDGMPSSECNGGVMPAGSVDRAGEFLIPTMNGIAVVDPDRVRDHAYEAPPSTIRMLRYDGQPLASSIMPASAGRVEFHYGGLYLPGADRLQYRYRLDGYDRDWTDARRSRIAAYTNLPPGDYTFRVQSRAGSTGWGRPASISFTKERFFHQTAWFRALAFFGVLGLAAGAVVLRIRTMKRRQTALETLVDERTQRLAREKAKTEHQAHRLAEMDAAKNRFFANISHEFRTPLTLLIGPLRDGLDGLHGPLPEAVRTRDRAMLDRAERLLHLVNQLLDLSKLESTTMKLDVASADIVAFVDSVVASLIPLAERSGITLEFQSDRPSMPAFFDADKIRQVFDNLISNAVKFTDEGGRIKVSLTADSDDFVEIVVKDTGSGIPPEVMPLLFDRFASSDAGRGVGIGLALAKELTELHGGSIRVESEPGFGSAFYVTLPASGAPPDVTLPAADASRDVTPPAAGPSSGVPAARVPPASGDGQAGEAVGRVDTVTGDEPPPDAGAKPHRILVVEDNCDVRSLLRGYLSSRYRVDEAENGTDALKLAHENLPDLIVSDVMMPGMDGVELCAAVRGDELLADTPFILLTARADDGDRVAGIDAGADAYIAKPFHRLVLLGRIEQLIVTRDRLRSRYSKEVVARASSVAVRSDAELFLETVLRAIEASLSNDRFTVDDLADAVNLSRRQLERKLREMTGETPAELVRRMRMERAAQLLDARHGTVAEVAAAVGYRSASHFSVAFKEAFGSSPSEHAA